MGLNEDIFEGIVIAILNQHVPDLSEGAITYKLSKEDKYISITATINATSQEQLDNLYLALNAEPRILMTL
jgi:hypothetical protein